MNRQQVKKWVGAAAVVSLIATTACSSGKENQSASSSPSASPTQAAASASASPQPTTSAPAEIKMYVSDFGKETPAKDNPFVKYMEGKTNTKLNLTFLPHGTGSQYLDNLKLKFAAGDFPDVYMNFSGPEADLIKNDKVLPLNDLIDKYGPNLKKYIPKQAWDAVSQNGKILAIPQPNTTSGNVLFIRKDWLDKLNLQVPKTSDELLNVLRAFRDGDPNGNGKKDEIPFSMREKISWGENIFGMWGVSTQWHEMYLNNEVIFANLTPNMLKGVEYLRTMYTEKLLDTEFLTNTKAIWEQKVKSGLVGVFDHVPDQAWQWQLDVTAGATGQKPDIIAIPTPRGTGYDGPLGTKWNPVSKTYIIFKSAKNPEAIVKYFDWLLSDEGQIFASLGIEGTTYKKEGDKLVFDTTKLKDVTFLTDMFAMNGYNDKIVQAKNPDPVAYGKIKTALDIVSKEGFVNEAVGMPPIANDFNMHTMFQEEAAKIITGADPVDKFNDFVATWRKQNGDKLIKERTDWYNQYRKK
ncbi:extracellular solute-binding protein [Paenibacillus cymbidii]|uniref:extracellular solute-binding protein n=1 Tax=Paenibacillus cymbidii TaxID=1639034 RepID=UPI001436B712|nr:extracellular solute-binding protein [Paenibacillus cymbidii]